MTLLKKKNCARCEKTYQPAGPAQRLCDDCWAIKTCQECGNEYTIDVGARRKNRPTRKYCGECERAKKGEASSQRASAKKSDTFICRDCHLPFPVSESVKDASRARGIMERCRPCDNLRKESYRQDPVTGPVQRVRVRDANRAMRKERKDAGMHWSDSLTDEQLEARRSQMRRYTREHRWNEIGASPEYYEAKLAEQNGRCAMCGRQDNPGRGTDTPGRKVRQEDGYFCIDHDHVTGELRGLLCTPCNLVIGNARDRPEILLAGLGYLAQYERTGP